MSSVPVLDSELSPRVDFFVHPDYHRLNGGTIDHRVLAYEEALHAQISASELPVLIQNSTEAAMAGEFWDRFDPDLRFTTQEGYGYLPINDMQHHRLNWALEDHDVLFGIVHGTYLAKCVTNFARSLHIRSRGREVLRYAFPHYDRSIPRTVKLGHVLNSVGNSTMADVAVFFVHKAEDSEIYFTPKES